MILSLCNEVLRDLPFDRQCAVAATLGYGGLEVAPFTLSDDPQVLPRAERLALRHAVEDHGLVVTGLHWLLVAPPGLSITHADGAVRRRTIGVMRSLVDLCADLGGTVLVHGSPAQRRVEDAGSAEAARDNALECFLQAAEAARAAGVTYCLEPLSRRETSFVNTIAEAVDLVDAVDSPAFATMIDTSAAAQAETEPVADLIRHWWRTGKLAHIQLNDRNRRAPGQGEDRFAPILAALRDIGYDGAVAVEPFVYEPDGPTTAAVAAGYVRGLLEGLGGSAR